jgi:hypothetical protein
VEDPAPDLDLLAEPVVETGVSARGRGKA